MEPTLVVSLAILAAAVVAVTRQVDVRLVLFLAALAIAALHGQTEIVVRKFIATFSDEKFVVPICTAMGFSYVLRQTGCDRHLVHLLAKPLLRVRPLLAPGLIVIGYLVNIPVVSQTSTAVAIGPVAIPILRAAGIPPVTIGAALLLGSSVGGELFNPGAPELRTTITESQRAARERELPTEAYDTVRCVQRLRPLNFLALGVATAVFCLLRRRDLRSEPTENAAPEPLATRVNVAKALVPIVPLAILYLTAPGIGLFSLPKRWLEDVPGQFETRLIGAAMLAGVAVAALTSPREIGSAAESFFQGAGYGFANIVSLIVTANCFGEALKIAGVAQLLARGLGDAPALLIPSAGVMSLAFAFLSGSGMATAQSLFGFFAGPALDANMDPTHAGAVVSLAAAAGRTMSPVAAVTMMCAKLTDVKPLELTRLVALPLLASTLAAIVAASLSVPTP